MTSDSSRTCLDPDGNPALIDVSVPPLASRAALSSPQISSASTRPDSREKRLRRRTMSGALHGLLLAGGKSSRMGRDKASMIFGPDGLTQASRALGLLRQFCDPVCLSLRAEQPVPSGGEGVQILRDAPEARGPLSGILAAFREAPHAAWLVLACDLPLLRASVLARLAARYAEDPSLPFVAYASAFDGLPEPLCAIYGPTAQPILERHTARGHFCPRHIMLEENALLLPLPECDVEALTNVNTPQDARG